jgi:hypothetical protein
MSKDLLPHKIYCTFQDLCDDQIILTRSLALPADGSAAALLTCRQSTEGAVLTVLSRIACPHWVCYSGRLSKAHRMVLSDGRNVRDGGPNPSIVFFG